jgi:hypothetical protein
MVESATKFQPYCEGLGRTLGHGVKVVGPVIEEARRNPQYGEGKELDFIFDQMERGFARGIFPEHDVDSMTQGTLKKMLYIKLSMEADLSSDG